MAGLKSEPPIGKLIFSYFDGHMLNHSDGRALRFKLCLVNLRTPDSPTSIVFSVF